MAEQHPHQAGAATGAPRAATGQQALKGCLGPILTLGLVVLGVVTLAMGPTFGIVVQAPAVCIGAAVIIWLNGWKPLRHLAETLFIVGVAILPQLWFVMRFDRLVQGGVEPGLAGRSLHDYEAFILALRAVLRPVLSLPANLMLLVTLGLLAVALRWANAAPLRALTAWRKWAGRGLVFLTAASAFTYFTAIPSGPWSPDLDARLQAHLRLGQKYQVERALAVQIEQALPAESDPLAAALADKAASAATIATIGPSFRYGLGGEAPEEAAVKAVADAYTDDVVAARLPSGADEPPPAPSAATLAQVRAAADQAKAAKQAADTARGILTGRLSGLVHIQTGSALGDLFLKEVVGRFIDKASDVVVRKGLGRLAGPVGRSQWLQALPEFSRAAIQELLAGSLDQHVPPARQRQIHDAAVDHARDEVIREQKRIADETTRRAEIRAEPAR